MRLGAQIWVVNALFTNKTTREDRIQKSYFAKIFKTKNDRFLIIGCFVKEMSEKIEKSS